MSQAEVKRRRALGIPDGAAHVLVLDQASHNDYDWVCAFSDFYGAELTAILGRAP